jgi:hypothetical protein
MVCFDDAGGTMRILLIGCAVLLRELSNAIVHSPHLVDAQSLPAGLHDTGAKTMRHRIQESIDGAEGKRYDTIALGYALCGTGLVGVRARTIPLVLPRAHDCITLLMGSRDKYTEYFNANPGVYFRSTGWVERDDELVEQAAGIGLSADLEALIEKYGEDAGRYLYDEMMSYRRSYSKLTFINTGLETNDSFKQRARAEATEKGWQFEEFAGSISLFRALLSGDWGGDFLIVPPGHQIFATNDEQIVAAVAANEASGGVLQSVSVNETTPDISDE